MFRRRPFRRRRFSRREPVSEKTRQELFKANQLKDKGQYAQAAELFEQLGNIAWEAEMPARAALLFIQGAHCLLLDGQTEPAFLLVERGLDILVEHKRLISYRRAVDQFSQELAQMGYAEQLAKFKDWLAQKDQGREIPPLASLDARASAGQTPSLPAKCPNCGANLRADEVEWLDRNHVECAYCGSTLKPE